uniref:non-specific serine/threonine protein kinase n=1 Tax=Cyprinus carpio carpio TaxID=630221 RepID=A0A8C1F237_CYPCA
DNSLQTPVHVSPDLSIDVSQAPVTVTVDCRVNDPQTTVCATSDCCVDISKTTICATSDCSVDVPKTTVCAKSDSDDHAPPAVFYAEPDSEDDAPPAVFYAKPDSNVDSPEAGVCQTEDRVSPQSAQICNVPHIYLLTDINSCSYEIGIHLGRGGFGTVYAVTCLKDGLNFYNIYLANHFCNIILDGYPKPVPLEVLLDWQEKPGYYMMVLEQPMLSQCLYEFIKNYKGRIREDLGQFIMRQATSAAQTCCQREVLYRDIKAENFLINLSNLEGKRIDFGCGDFLTDIRKHLFLPGTKQYCPPKYLMTSRYHGESVTVWSLWILLFMEDYIQTKDACHKVRSALQHRIIAILKLTK